MHTWEHFRLTVLESEKHGHSQSVIVSFSFIALSSSSAYTDLK